MINKPLMAVVRTLPAISSGSLSRQLLLLVVCLLANTSQAQDFNPEQLRQAISGPDREVSDFIRDSVRRPIEVLQFLGVETGMQILDLYAAGGYYTFILSKAVGDAGVVYAQNTTRGRQFVEDRQEITQGQALDAKIRSGNLQNVVQIVAPLRELEIPSGTLDGIMIAQTLHDYYNSNPERALAMLRQMRELLKPGGFIGITDHVGIEGNNNSELHRMAIDQAKAVANEAGFEVNESQLLRVDTDDYSRSIFDPRLNRSTDRFLLKLSKPKL